MPNSGRGRIRLYKEERLRHRVVVAMATEPELLPALHFRDSQTDASLPDVAFLCSLMRWSWYEPL